MDFRRNTQESRAEKVQARARKARKLARFVKLALICAITTAIWQDRGLAPRVHDRMQLTVAMVSDWIEQSENGNSYLTAMTIPFGGGNQSEFGPITDALLKLRQ